jgi:putative protease
LNFENVLSNCANRDSVPQFFNGKYDSSCSYYNGRMEISNQDFLAVVNDYSDGFMIIEQRNYFKVGDEVQIFGPSKDVINFKITEMYDLDGNFLDVARHPKQVIKIPINFKVSKWDLIRKKNVDKINKV